MGKRLRERERVGNRHGPVEAEKGLRNIYLYSQYEDRQRLWAHLLAEGDGVQADARGAVGPGLEDGGGGGQGRGQAAAVHGELVWQLGLAQQPLDRPRLE